MFQDFGHMGIGHRENLAAKEDSVTASVAFEEAHCTVVWMELPETSQIEERRAVGASRTAAEAEVAP